MKKYASFSALLLFLIAGLAVGAFVDLNLTQSLYNPQNILGIFMEAFGFYPLYLPTALMFAAGVFLVKTPIKRLGMATLCATVLGVLSYMGFHYLIKRQAIWMFFVIFIGIALVLVPVVVNKNRRDVLIKLCFTGAFGFVYMILNNVIVNILKLIWQRPRFDDMLSEGRLSSFAPWYNIMGEGGSSFPSGHTAAACGIFTIIVLCSLFAHLEPYRGAMLMGCFVYVGAMSLGRMIIGRHFLSDTVMAIFIGYSLFAIMIKTPIYQKTLAGTLTAASEND